MKWIRELQAISQTGLHFGEDRYNRERYEQIGKIAAEMLSEISNLPVDEILNFNKAEFGYATPKVDVRGVIFRTGKILLAREVADADRWTIPGGWADVNEAPSVATAREVREETGFDVSVKKLLAVYDRDTQGHQPPHPCTVYKHFFLCEITGGKPQLNCEISEIDFFDENNIPPDLSTARVTEKQIHRFFEHLKNPDMPTDFD
ncbi:MAG: NUDIX hydrolase [Kiritimatiellales bacterium]